MSENSQQHKKVKTEYGRHTTSLLKMIDVSKGKGKHQRKEHLVEALSVSLGGSNSCQYVREREKQKTR